MSGRVTRRLARRELLRESIFAGGALLAGLCKARWPVEVDAQETNSSRVGKMLGVVEFSDEARVPMGEAFGAELDGRLYTDLSGMTAQDSTTPTEHFYIRTRASNLLESQKPWSVQVNGQGEKPVDLSTEELRRMAGPRGLHLMECAGNTRSVHFGMISVANWTGTPLAEVLERAKAKPHAKRVLISGFDRYAAKSASSVPGASWVFTVEELTKAGAFLATEMNGSALTRDHGAPVRLVVPGWYGCTCIKWVNEITFTDEAVAATSQMQEYAARTMQSGVPRLARDFKPAIIEQAAMPIRVEKWAIDETIRYRVVGVLWGGSVPVTKLQIRFNPEEDYVDVDNFRQTTNDPWSFWTHSWAPERPGTYMIRLRVADPGVVARRLEAGYYVRNVEVLEI
jgi:DMSO/TMAO reductase YedYZ molybdopterin-dependent catalytic subunit